MSKIYVGDLPLSAAEDMAGAASLLPGPLYANPAEHRRRVQQAAEERAAQRDSELESQTAPLKNPEERIVIWERLHALRLPRAPGHVLVEVIAKRTGLRVDQVHEEQQRRAGMRSQSPLQEVKP